jgi:hypothetical protein
MRTHAANAFSRWCASSTPQNLWTTKNPADHARSRKPYFANQRSNCPDRTMTQSGIHNRETPQESASHLSMRHCWGNRKTTAEAQQVVTRSFSPSYCPPELTGLKRDKGRCRMPQGFRGGARSHGGERSRDRERWHAERRMALPTA